MKSIVELELTSDSPYDGLEFFHGQWGLNLAMGGQSPPTSYQHRVHLPKLVKLTVNKPALDILVHIIAPALHDLDYTGEITECDSALGTFLFESGCHLRTLRLRTVSTARSLIQLLLTHSNTFCHTRGMQLSHTDFAHAIVPHRPRGSQESEEDTARIVALFNRTETQYAHLFPQLCVLSLQNMAAPVTPVIDMLQSRRDPELGTQLVSCDLEELTSQHRQSTEEDVRQVAQAVARSRSLNARRGFDYHDGYFGPETAARFYWVEGLERELEQKARLEKLQEDGLESYLKAPVEYSQKVRCIHWY